MAPMTWLGSSAALAILSFDVDAETPILAVSRRYACGEAARRAQVDEALPRRSLPPLDVDPAVYPE
jgi:hypothetical protein